MKYVLLFILTIISCICGAQELYVFSEPASNMPAKSLSFKLTSRFPQNRATNVFKQRYTPELMLGVNKNLMVHLTTSFSDYHFSNIRYDGVRIYGKYRFLSNDEV